MRKNRELQRKTSGFTLVEMIVTLLVLAIVAAISVPALLGFIDEGHAKQCEANKKALAEEIVSARMAYEVNGKNAEEGKTGKEFDEDKVIASSNLKCPTKGEYTYDPKTDEIVCDDEKHDGLKVPNSGKYDVSVKKVSQTEAKASSEPSKPSGESTPGTSEDAPSPTPSEEPTPGTSEDIPSPTPSEEPTPGTSEDTPSPTPGEASGPTPGLYIELRIVPGTLSIKEGQEGLLTAIAVVKNEDGAEQREREVTLTWSISDEDVATVEVQDDTAVTAKVVGVKAGSTTVTVTATADGVATATAQAPVKVTEEGSGLFIMDLPDPLYLEADHISALVNQMQNFLNMWIAEGKRGGTWEAKGLDTSNAGNYTFAHDHENDRATFTYTLGDEYGSLNVRVVHPMESIQINDNREFPMGTTILDTVVQTVNPYFTTDSIQEWNIISGEECINIVKLLENGTKAEIETLQPGEVTLELVAPRQRGSDIPASDSKWNPLKYTVHIKIKDNGGGNAGGQQWQNPGITGVTLNPSSMTLKVGESKQITAELQTNGNTVDMSKVTYEFNRWDWNIVDMSQSQQGNMETVTGEEAGTTTITVIVKYDGNQVANAMCPVVVEKADSTFSENEVLIDGQRFGAQSWEQFKKNVEEAVDRSYKVNQHRGEENADKIVLYYDEIEENGVKRRVLYIAKGNSANFSIKDTPVSGSNSFEEFLRTNGGKDKFFAVDLDHIKYVSYDQYENLSVDANEECPEGTIVRVERSPGVYKYYVAYDPGNRKDDTGKKTQLGSIWKYGQEDTKNNGWWELELLP